MFKQKQKICFGLLFFFVFCLFASQVSAFRLTPRMKNKKTRVVQRVKQIKRPPQSSIVNPEESEVKMPKYSQPSIVDDDYIEDKEDEKDLEDYQEIKKDTYFKKTKKK